MEKGVVSKMAIPDQTMIVVSSPLTAEGNSQATALLLAADWNLVATVAAMIWFLVMSARLI